MFFFLLLFAWFVEQGVPACLMYLDFFSISAQVHSWMPRAALKLTPPLISSVSPFSVFLCGWSLAQNDDINIYNWQFATIHILLVLIPVVFLGEGPDYIINNCQLSTIPLHFYPLSCGLNSDQLSIIPILYYLLSYVGKSLNCNITN